MSEDIEAQRSCIPNFYKGKTIFITGVTGFMGKVLLEKLLRSCPDICRVYTLVRTKKGQNPKERIDAIIKSQVFYLLLVNNMCIIIYIFKITNKSYEEDDWHCIYIYHHLHILQDPR